mgnify:CR=1 FL=1
MNAFVEEHLEVFCRHLPDATKKEQLVGFDIKKWWGDVSPQLDKNYPVTELPQGQMTRTQLKELCQFESGWRDWECAVAIMAWGVQRRNHGVMLFNRFKEIEPIIRDMRSDILTPFDAYKRFDQIWKQPKPLGMGAAYFTKLIFFCEPSHNGDIMDQWTSKSINLLTGENIVYLSDAGQVNKWNCVKNYETYCSYVKELASKLNTSSEEIEIAMFSKGGKKKAGWRQYVVDHTNK